MTDKTDKDMWLWKFGIFIQLGTLILLSYGYFFTLLPLYEDQQLAMKNSALENKIAENKAQLSSITDKLNSAAFYLMTDFVFSCEDVLDKKADFRTCFDSNLEKLAIHIQPESRQADYKKIIMDAYYTAHLLKEPYLNMLTIEYYEKKFRAKAESDPLHLGKDEQLRGELLYNIETSINYQRDYLIKGILHTTIKEAQSAFIEKYENNNSASS